MKTKLDFTAIIEKSEDGWFVGQLEELPEVISQGRDIDELMSNLKDAAELILTYRREQSISTYSHKNVLRKKLSLS